MLLKLEGLDFPSSAEQIFGRTGPLVMEAGFGDGWFLSQLAQKNPSWNIVGADISSVSASRAFRRMQRDHISHVRLHRGTAQFVLRNLIPPRGLHRIYVNYPDPWPKKRHHANRLLCANFLRMLSTRLVAGGTLHLTTDHEEYFAAALAEARSTKLFAIKEEPPPPAVLQTKYARKWQARNLAICHARFEKIAETPDSFPPAIETFDTMHHALLTGSLPSLDTFESFVHTFPTGRVVFLNAMQPVGHTGLVFTARVIEDNLSQDVLIEVRPVRKGPADVLAGINAFGKPLSTRGTQEAIHAMTQYLSKHGLRILESYY